MSAKNGRLVNSDFFSRTLKLWQGGANSPERSEQRALSERSQGVGLAMGVSGTGDPDGSAFGKAAATSHRSERGEQGDQAGGAEDGHHKAGFGAHLSAFIRDASAGAGDGHQDDPIVVGAQGGNRGSLPSHLILVAPPVDWPEAAVRNLSARRFQK